MRLTLIGAALSISACAGTPTDATQPLNRACSVADCFLERDVRDFEVLDQTTVIVYVGAQRCAFKVEVRGTFCDLTFAPEIFFHSTNELETSSSRDPFGQSTQNNRTSDLRVCSGDLKVGVDGGVFTETTDTGQPRDRLGNIRSQCSLSRVASLTDDQVLELYVAHEKVAPPPPMGAGQIEVGEQNEEGAPSTGDAPGSPPTAAPTGGEPQAAR
jgi:hypothetical protein